MRRQLLTLDDVAEILNVSWAQAYALVTSRDLEGVQIGGRKQWRVDPARLDRWLEAKHADTASGPSPRPSLPTPAAQAPAAPDNSCGMAATDAGPT